MVKGKICDHKKRIKELEARNKILARDVQEWIRSNNKYHQDNNKLKAENAGLRADKEKQMRIIFHLRREALGYRIDLLGMRKII